MGKKPKREGAQVRAQPEKRGLKDWSYKTERILGADVAQKRGYLELFFSFLVNMS